MAKRALLYALALLAVAPLTAQEPLNADINAKIRQEEASHSQIMRTLHMFTDVYGPRVTGSPNHKAAGEWAFKQMASLGLDQRPSRAVGLRPSGLGQRALFGAHHRAGQGSADAAKSLAWTPGTDGTVTARGLSADRCRSGRPRPADGVSRRRDGQGQRADRAGRQARRSCR